MSSLLEQAIDRLHGIVAQRQPEWPQSSSFYRFDPLRHGNLEHGLPFVDWRPTDGEFSNSTDHPGTFRTTSGSFWMDKQECTALISAATFEDLKVIQFALASATPYFASGSFLDIQLGTYTNLNEPGAQETSFQIEQRFTVSYNVAIVNRNQLTTVLTASLLTSGSVAGEDLDEGELIRSSSLFA